MSIWQPIHGKPNNAEWLELKGGMLAHLILNVTSVIHTLTATSLGITFSIAQKQYSEAEMAAFYTALCQSFIVRFINTEHASSLIEANNKGIVGSLFARVPDRTLSEYFLLRFTLLSEVIMANPEFQGSFLPGFRESYQVQCGLLNTLKNASVATSAQHLVMNNVRRWELRELVTGEHAVT